MRAIVIATDNRNESSLLSDRLPAVLIPLVDRPFLQHVVEHLIEHGVTEFDFVLSHLPEKIEERFGDGTRWGSRFRYHLARDAARPYRLLKSLLTASDPVLIAHADRLPSINPETHLPAGQNSGPVVFISNGAERTWTGWAWVTAAQIAELSDAATFEELGAQLCVQAEKSGNSIEVGLALSFAAPGEMIEAQGRLLSKQFDGLMVSGQEAEPGIWLSRNVSLHPTARLIAPVFIGENCRIGPGAQIGPNAVVGGDCILEKHATVSNSLILSGSYVGEGLELDESIVDKNRLVNVRVGIAVSVADNFILGSLSDRHIGNWAEGFVSRLFGLLLLIAAAPLLLLSALWLKLFRRGPLVYRTETVRLPSPPEEHEWRTFDLLSFGERSSQTSAMQPIPVGGWRGLFLHLLPGLINVARGELRMVGVPPRTKDEVLALSADWRALYLSANAGLITEAYVLYGNRATEDELYASEAVYAVNAGVGHDLRLIGGYLGRLLTGR